MIGRYEQTIVRRVWADTNLDIIFLVFCCSSCRCFLGVLSSHLRSGTVSASRSSPKIDPVIFGHFLSNCRFFCFLSRVHSHYCSIWVSFRQSEPVADLLLTRFYFEPGRPQLSQCSLGNPSRLISNSFLPYSFSNSLCLFAFLDSLSHICSFLFRRLMENE